MLKKKKPPEKVLHKSEFSGQFDLLLDNVQNVLLFYFKGQTLSLYGEGTLKSPFTGCKLTHFHTHFPQEATDYTGPTGPIILYILNQ